MKNFQQYLEAIKNKITESKYNCKDNQCNFWLEYQNKYYKFSIVGDESDITPEQVIAKIDELTLNPDLKARIINTIEKYGGWKSYFSKT